MAPRASSAARVVPRNDGPNRKKKHKKTASPAPEAEARVSRRVAHEVLAVLLCCGGLLTLLSLLSYDLGDASLNSASATPQVHNWIGPAGAYWSDALLQSLGVGAYALALGALLAGWRSLVGRRVLPGLREAVGTLCLIACSGTLAELLLQGESSYPAGGVGGAVLAAILLEQFALLGSVIIASSLVLIALALTADGILRGLGLRGLSVARDGASRVMASWTLLREQQRHLRALRQERREREKEEQAAEAAKVVSLPEWGWDEEREAQRDRERKERVEQAKAKAEALARKKAEAEAARLEQARQASLGERRAAPSLPSVVLDQTVDLPAEEVFELGKLTLDPDAGDPAFVESDDDDGLNEVPIREASPDLVATERLVVSAPAPLPAPTVPESTVSPEKATAKKSGVGAEPARPEEDTEPEIVDVRPEVNPEAIAAAAEHLAEEKTEFELPSTALLDFEATERAPIDPAKLKENAQKLVRTLKEYKIDGTIREIRPGPVVTMYEFVPAPGIKISKIAGLADDLAMSMAAMRVRIVAPIPGKGAVGIEIPNDHIETVFYKEIITNDAFKKAKSRLTIALGKDIEGKAVVANLAKMPHLLVAGATGSGKSVSVNAMIMSILFKATPEEVRFIMVDPKMLELSVYNGIPHLLLPVVTDPKKASLALRWAVEEMERRYRLLSEAGVKNIDGFNGKVKAARDRGQPFTLPPEKDGDAPRVCETMPYIVVIVDELADLMMVASREVEGSIMRMAQMARAAGIHLILATQRPSVDVITGSIKANLPTRMAFRVAQKNDSRTILDQNGAQNLLGRGDMLYMSNGANGVQRIHGAYVNEEEVERTVEFIKAQGRPQYDESILKPRAESSDSGGGDGDDERDEMYDKAIAIVTETRQASISMIQRKLKIGYNRAARMVEQMEAEGIVGPPDGAKPRQVLAPPPPEA